MSSTRISLRDSAGPPIVSWILAGVAVSIGLALPPPSQSQSAEAFRARLSQAPPLGIPAETVRGTGEAQAMLINNMLEVTGTFEQLTSPATEAHLCWGPVTGVRGDPVFELTVTRAGDGASGALSGAFELSPAQVDAIQQGQFYIQLHSEGAPEGHLIGWLLE